MGPSTEAALWHYRRAADLGVSAAFSGLGYMYMHGQGVEMNKTRAMELMERASEEGDTQASTNLAVLLLDGAGDEEGGGSDEGQMERDWNRVQRNASRARVHLERAAAAGILEGQYNLALMEHYGWDGKPNCTAALPWMRAVAERGVWKEATMANRDAADLAWSPPTPDPAAGGTGRRSVRLAVTHFAALSALGLADAQSDLGFILSRGYGRGLLGNRGAVGDVPGFLDWLWPAGGGASMVSASTALLEGDPRRVLEQWDQAISTHKQQHEVEQQHESEAGVSNGDQSMLGALASGLREAANASLKAFRAVGSWRSLLAAWGLAPAAWVEEAEPAPLSATADEWSAWAVNYIMGTLHKEAGSRGQAYSLRELGYCHSPGGRCFSGTLAAAEGHLEAGIALRDGHSFHGMAHLLTSRELRLTWAEVLGEAREGPGASLNSAGDGAQAVWLGHAPVPWHRVWRLLESCIQSDYLADLPVALSTAEAAALMARRAVANTLGASTRSASNVTLGVFAADAIDLLFGALPPLPPPPAEDDRDGAVTEDSVITEAEAVPLSPHRGDLGSLREHWRIGNEMPFGPLWLSVPEARVAAAVLKAGFLTGLMLLLTFAGLLFRTERLFQHQA